MSEQQNKDKAESLIEYRLNQIEEKIDSIMDVMSRQQEETAEIKSIAKEQIKITETLKDHEERIRKCEIQPATTKAEKWDLIIKTIMTILITAVVSFVLVKVGLK